jgi:hypothetical protein
VLEDLEKVMPARVHVVSIHPELDEDNQLKLKMQVGGDSREKALDLARRMEDSRYFTQTYIQSEDDEHSNTGDLLQITLVATYVPETVPLPAPKTETSKPKTETSKPKTETSKPKTETSNRTAP